MLTTQQKAGGRYFVDVYIQHHNYWHRNINSESRRRREINQTLPNLTSGGYLKFFKKSRQKSTNRLGGGEFSMLENLL